MIRADVIADSVSTFSGMRLTTMQVTFPRCILAEVNTHRVFSRNSASSRAVPVKRMLEQVRTNPFIPIRWQSAQAGMQGGDQLDEAAQAIALKGWLRARDHAADEAEHLLALGLHKTMPNRLLEPFAWHTAIISGTDWAGFWQQRCSPLAEVHMEAAATAMRAAYEASTPVEMGRGEWHLPYVTADERREFGEFEQYRTRMISAARCARVSYLTHDGVRDVAADIALFDKLVTADPPHWSPLEHQATPHPSRGRQAGNFGGGWEQYRHQVERAR